MSKKNGIQKANYNQKKKTFPAFVTITETVAVEEIMTKDGCVRRRAYAKQVRVAQSSQPKMLPKEIKKRYRFTSISSLHVSIAFYLIVISKLHLRPSGYEQL